MCCFRSVFVFVRFGSSFSENANSIHTESTNKWNTQKIEIVKWMIYEGIKIHFCIYWFWTFMWLVCNMSRRERDKIARFIVNKRDKTVREIVTNRNKLIEIMVQTSYILQFPFSVCAIEFNWEQNEMNRPYAKIRALACIACIQPV